jgi:hypothetical protein
MLICIYYLVKVCLVNHCTVLCLYNVLYMFVLVGYWSDVVL